MLQHASGKDIKRRTAYTVPPPRPSSVNYFPCSSVRPAVPEADRLLGRNPPRMTSQMSLPRQVSAWGGAAPLVRRGTGRYLHLDLTVPRLVCCKRPAAAPLGPALAAVPKVHGLVAGRAGFAVLQCTGLLQREYM